MYEELVKMFRTCSETDTCIGCPYLCTGLCDNKTEKAADAIEELSRDLDSMNEANIALYGELHRWISVTERLPIGGDDSGAICENVCLLMDDGTVSCGWMNGITKKVYYLNARDDVVIKAPITRVTHWMPLPEPPKEVE